MDSTLKNSINRSLEKSGIEVELLLPINAGINSLSWEIRNKESSYFLKKYITNPFDKRNRLDNEINFLQLLLSNNFKNIPKPICFSKKHNWALLSWLNGNTIQSPNLNDWDKLINFLADIQKIKDYKKTSKISIASETFGDFLSHKNFIEKRIRSFQIILKNNNYIDLSNWVEENLTTKIINFKARKYKSFSKKSNGNFDFILSPSDIGFHNCIKNNKKLYFFDFEYAGWDDQYKQFTDLIIQPENVLENYQANKLLKRFSGILDKEINFEILQEYIFIYRLKWTLIVLKQLLYMNSTKFKHEEVFFKAINYFERIGKIWLSN